MRVAALGLVGILGVLSGGTALAADLVVGQVMDAPMADTEFRPYVKLYGGATIPNTLEWDGGDYDVDAGWLLGGSLGVQINENLAVELDGTYSASSYSGTGNVLNAATLMVNAVVSGPLSDQIAVYGGLGLGGVGGQYDGGDWAYAAGGQAFVGVSFSVAENVSIFGEARYQAAFDLIDDGVDQFEIQRTAVLGGVSFGF